jgi:hypothetical protein
MLSALVKIVEEKQLLSFALTTIVFTILLYMSPIYGIRVSSILDQSFSGNTNVVDVIIRSYKQLFKCPMIL